MIIDNLYELLLDKEENNLIGELTYEGIAIKWTYDSFNREFDYDESELEHLHRICENDLDIINEHIDGNTHHISDATIEDTYISFYIEE